MTSHPRSPSRFLFIPFPFLREKKVKGVVTADLGSHEIVSSRGNKSRAAMFALLVTEVLDTWPEKHRRRKVVREKERERERGYRTHLLLASAIQPLTAVIVHMLVGWGGGGSTIRVSMFMFSRRMVGTAGLSLALR